MKSNNWREWKKLEDMPDWAQLVFFIGIMLPIAVFIIIVVDSSWPFLEKLMNGFKVTIEYK